MQTWIVWATVRSAMRRTTPGLRRRFAIGCFATAGVLLSEATYLFLTIGAMPLDELAQYLFVIAMIGGFVGGFTLIELGRRLRASDGVSLVEPGKEFVLYLRPFSADLLRNQREHGVFALVPPERYEEAVVAVLRTIAPVVAVQRPGEVLPPLGAARLKTSDDWRSDVEALIRRAKLIVLAGGTSEGLRWELDTVLRYADPRRLLVFLGLSDDWSNPDDRRAFIRSLPSGSSSGVIGSDTSLFVLSGPAWDPIFVEPESGRDWANGTEMIVGTLRRALTQMPWLRVGSARWWRCFGAHLIGASYILLLLLIGCVHQAIVFYDARQQPWGRHLRLMGGLREIRETEETWRLGKARCTANLRALETGEFYTHGSSRQAVLMIQGQPLEENSFSLRYGSGRVVFLGDRVESWWPDFDYILLGGPKQKLLKARSLGCDASMLPAYEGLDRSKYEIDSIIAKDVERRLRSRNARAKALLGLL